MRRDCAASITGRKAAGLVWRGKAITTWIKPAERIIEREAPSKHHGKRQTEQPLTGVETGTVPGHLTII